MNKGDFKFFISKMASYYDSSKVIENQRLELWFEAVKDIDADALEFIQKRICADKELMPKNLPKYMLEHYGAWRAEQRAKRPKFETTDCPDCEGDGIFVAYMLNETAFRYCKKVFACGACENWRKHFGALECRIGPDKNIVSRVDRVTKGELEGMQWFAGYDRDYDSIQKVKELNDKMQVANEEH